LPVVARLLQDERVDPAADDNAAIQIASRNGHLPVVDRLLQDERVDSAANSNYAIQLASQYCHLPVVERLLQDERVDPAADDNYAIRMASEYGQVPVVDRLLQDARVDPAANSNFAIRMASRNGHFSTLVCLLQHLRVNATCLHTLADIDSGVTTAAAADQLSLAAVQRLSATLTLPFPIGSRILAWQPRIRAYREEAVALAAELTANWRLYGSGGGVSEEVMDDIVWVYCFGGLRLSLYRELDSTQLPTL
jgi:predicted ATPase